MQQSPSLELLLAPTQLYILLAITVATLAWLLKPSPAGKAALRECLVGLGLVVVQVLQLWIHDWIPPGVALVLHGMSAVAYIVVSAWLFTQRWREAKSAPPSHPSVG
jgi:uncharacterized membrane protein